MRYRKSSLGPMGEYNHAYLPIDSGAEPKVLIMREKRGLGIVLIIIGIVFGVLAISGFHNSTMNKNHLAGCLICVAALTVGVALIINSFIDIKKRLVNKGKGEKIRATVTYVGLTEKEVDYRLTYWIIAKWQDSSGVSHKFYSELLYVDLSRYISKGDLIDVYVDPKNYKRYYVCATELEKEYEKKAEYKGKMI